MGSIPTTPASREIRQKQKLDCKIGLLFLLHLGNLYCNCSANRRGLFFWHTNAPFSLIGAFQDRQNGANTMTVQIRVKSAHFLRIRRAGRTLRLRSKRRGGGFATARAVPISSELRCAPLRREMLCAEGQRAFPTEEETRKRRRAQRAAGESALSADSGVWVGVRGQGREKAAWRRSRHLPKTKAKPHEFGAVCCSDKRRGICAVLLFILWKDKLRRCQRLSATAKRACQYGVEISVRFTVSPGEGLYIISP